MRPIHRSLVLAALTALLIALSVTQLVAQDQPTPNPATIEAYVQSAFTQTAQAEILSAAVLQARTATAAAITPTVTLTPTPVPFSVPGLRLADVTIYPLMAAPLNTSAHLAPDGETFLHIDQATFCLYAVSGEQRACDTLEDDQLRGGIDSETVQWSPDSTRLAFTSDSLRTFNDSDIWLYDTGSRSFTNLTDDGTTASFLSDKTGFVNFDLAPTWSPDGEQIAFLRYPLDLSGDSISMVSLEICILTLAARNESCSAPFSEQEFSLSVYYLDWSSDGTFLVFPSDQRGDITPGLWRYDLASQTAEHVAPLVIGVSYAPEQVLDFGTVQVSPDNRQVLVMIPALFSSFGGRASAETSGFRVTGLETGETVLIDDERFVRGAGWLPDGGLVFVSWLQSMELDSPLNEGAPYFLYATDRPGGDSRLLFMPDEVPETEAFRNLIPPTSRGMKPLVWSARNSVLLTTERDLTFLFTFTTSP